MPSGRVRENGEITGFEIEGVSDSLCERFSKRRGEIERQIEKFEEKQGRKPTVKEIALITRETRPAELKEIATAEVLALQRSQLSPEERKQLQALRAQVGGADRADSNWSGTGCPSRECRAFIRTAKRSAGA